MPVGLNNSIPSSVFNEYKDGIIPITKKSVSYSSYIKFLNKEKFTDPTILENYNIFWYPKNYLLTDEKRESKTKKLFCLIKGVAKVTTNGRFVSYIYPDGDSGKLIGTVNIKTNHVHASATVQLITDSIIAVMELDDELRERLLTDTGFLRNLLYEDLRNTICRNNAVADLTVRSVIEKLAVYILLNTSDGPDADTRIWEPATIAAIAKELDTTAISVNRCLKELKTCMTKGNGPYEGVTRKLWYKVSVKDLISYTNGISATAAIGKFYNPAVINGLSYEAIQQYLGM